MNYSLSTIAEMLAGSSTINPDKTNLDAGTVASVVITGIVVVFLALVLLILFVSLYGMIFEKINKAQAEKKKAAEEAKKAAMPKPAPKPVQTVAPEPVVEDGIEEETVAVIMAAIEAMSSQNGKKMVLKSVKTAKPQRPVWSSAGIIENTRPF